jgi:PadR family transcriptional regulator PadR
MPIGSSDLLQGTLQILILKALLAESTHGYGIARWIEGTTDDVLRVEEGSLYPALRRLEAKEYIDAQWGLSDNNRRAKYYALTAAGRAHLKKEAEAWTRFSVAMTRVMRAAPALG